MEDTFQHKGLRKLLVEELRRKGIKDERVLAAIGRIKRHLFFESALLQFAYKDAAFPIKAGQTISQPYTVARQTELLELQERDKVLEIGTGSGYQATVLSEMGCSVYTIERQRELFISSQRLLMKLNYNRIHFFYGDGYAGLPNYAPFDKIIVTAGAEEIPQTLLQQLKVGGIMVIPVGKDGKQQMLRLYKKTETEVELTQHGDCAFVPFLNGKVG